MTFGEKLFRLRKEKGLSQEALAEKCNTTRQAVSKWENNQGYPETEKLLMLSNIFGVSVDHLLKENPDQINANENGYYVSRECAEGFLSFHRKTTERTAIGAAVMVLGGVPYFLFENNRVVSIALACVCIVAGLAFIFSMAMMGNPYKKLKSERLLFDPAYFADLEKNYQSQKNRYIAFLLLGISLILLAGILEFAGIPMFPLIEIQCLLTACSVYLFIYTIGVMDTYDILLKSEERMESVYWKVMKKIKK